MCSSHPQTPPACTGTNGLVVEIGCGSGLLTAYLVDAGLNVVASDASDAMLNLCKSHVPGAAEIRRLTLPGDPIPSADAIVGVGHALNYLDEESQIEAALVAIATSLRPGGIITIDLCDLEWGAVRANHPPKVLADGGLGADNGVFSARSKPVCADHDNFRPT